MTMGGGTAPIKARLDSAVICVSRRSRDPWFRLDWCNRGHL